MGEPAATVAPSDTVACTSSDASENGRTTGRKLANELFLGRPAGTRWGAVRRVRRNVDHQPDLVLADSDTTRLFDNEASPACLLV
jgi:hypothetical protein